MNCEMSNCEMRDCDRYGVCIRKLIYTLEDAGVAHVGTDEYRLGPDGKLAELFTFIWERRPRVAEFRNVVAAVAGSTPPNWVELYDMFLERVNCDREILPTPDESASRARG